MAHGHHRLTADHNISHPDTGKSMVLAAGTIVIPTDREMAGIGDRLVPLTQGEAFAEDEVFVFGRYYSPPVPKDGDTEALAEAEAAEKKAATTHSRRKINAARRSIQDAGGFGKITKAVLEDMLDKFSVNVEEGTGAEGRVTKRDLVAAMSRVLGL